MNQSPTNFAGASMVDPIAIADHAARQSDRWLLVALLVVFLVGIGLVGRWLAGQANRILDQWRADMNAIQSQLNKLHEERLSAAERYAASLSQAVRSNDEDAKALLRDYAAVTARNTEAFSLVRMALNDLQQSCAIARIGASLPPRGGGDAISASPSPAKA